MFFKLLNFNRLIIIFLDCFLYCFRFSLNNKFHFWDLHFQIYLSVNVINCYINTCNNTVCWHTLNMIFQNVGIGWRHRCKSYSNILKMSATVIYESSTHSFNLSLFTGNFPSKLKLSRVTSLYKLGDNAVFADMNNYSL